MHLPDDNHSSKAHYKNIFGWAIYDWANSAFATTVMAGFFPIFFKQYWNHGVDATVSTARLGLGNAAASLVVALMAPIMGAIADSSGKRKHFLISFTYLGVLMTAALTLIPQGQWATAIAVYILGIIGYSGAVVFYDSLLPHIAPADKLDQVSSLGYALGYLGGGLLFAFNVFMTLKPAMFGLANSGQAVRISFATVAVWWAGFTLITILWLPADPKGSKMPFTQQIKDGWRQFINTFKKISRQKTIFIFLLAYWCYIDGVDTIVRMAVDYGISLGFESNDLITALLITQFVGFPSAIFFGFLGKRWGVRRSIYLALVIYIGITLWGASMKQVSEFYLLAVAIGLVQGGIQALSRSYFARLIPLEWSAEYFGFYNMLGKFAAIIGPTLMAITGLAAKRILMPPEPSAEQIRQISLTASRTGIVSVLLLFIIGGVLFYFAKEEKIQK
ncbi:MAG: MFS transporter [Desulfobacteraceae bacterium]|nr:MFS transporter [Desulfobacteraceae bacterium]